MRREEGEEGGSENDEGNWEEDRDEGRKGGGHGKEGGWEKKSHIWESCENFPKENIPLWSKSPKWYINEEWTFTDWWGGPITENSNLTHLGDIWKHCQDKSALSYSVEYRTACSCKKINEAYCCIPDPVTGHFCFCRAKKSYKFHNIHNWWICVTLACLCVFVLNRILFLRHICFRERLPMQSVGWLWPHQSTAWIHT